MFERAFQSLELPKVLARLASHALSEAGREACLALRPASGLNELRQRADFFQQGRLWLERSGFSLTAFPSLEGVLRFLDSPAALLDLDALWALRQTLALAKEAQTSLSGESGQKPQDEWPLLLARTQSFAWPVQSMAALARCLSDDGLLRDEASPELSLARGEIRRLHQMCTRRVKDFIQGHNLEQFIQDSYMTLSSDRYVLPLKSNFKGRIPGIIHDYSQTGETCYFEPMFLVEVNNRLQELRREEREAELKVLRYLTDLLLSEFSGVRGTYALLVDLDRLQASAALAAAYDGCMVEFGDDRPVELREARHPLLALAHAASPSAPAPVAVDLVLKPGQKALVISGGNAGGKTVALKTLGLNALIGMCGLPVPASRGGSLPFWKSMRVFIGDEQSLEDHVSTFTAQIQHLAKGWDGTGPGTLVILDEFGAGTDPAQGAALAQAVVDSLMERGAHVAAATHFPAMKAYALSNERVRAASVLFDPRSKKPLFRLAYDQVGASQALDVAKEHGLPEEVLRRAGHYLLLDGADTAALVERLNSLAVAREDELDELKAERASFAEKRRRLEERFEAERGRLFGQVQKEAQSVLADWKASRVSHKQALKELSKIRKTLLRPEPGAERDAAAPEAGALDLASLTPGMSVCHMPWGKTGTVVDVDARRGRVRLDLSGVTLWTEAGDLAPTARGGGKTEKISGGVTLRNASSAGLRLDLRGMRADVAITELERFLDAALLGGKTEVEILHGRGTGALRREVHTYLKRCSTVGSFSLAPEDQGGDGVTVAALK